MSYELSGFGISANNLIKQMGSIGKVEKHLPENILIIIHLDGLKQQVRESTNTTR